MSSRTSALVVGLVGVVVGGACAASCGERSGFVDAPAAFGDAATVDSAACLVTCSVDGRSVLDCNGNIVTTCADDQACGGGKCQEPCAAAAADQQSNGCEFYFQPPLFTKLYGQSCYAAYVTNPGVKPATLSLTFQGKSLDVSKAFYAAAPGSASLTLHPGPILPGESAVLFVSDLDPSAPQGATAVRCPAGVVAATYLDGLPEGTGIGDSFYLASDAPVALAAIYPYGGAPSFFPSATLLLPLPTWGLQHIVVNAWKRVVPFSGQRPVTTGPGAQIVASEDDTSITILPNQDIQDGLGVIGTAAFVPATYHLNKGQVLQINQSDELSGSIVTSTKPTSVFGGHECMDIPDTRVACDTALQQIPPFAQWGSEYAAVGYRPRVAAADGELMPYRFVAARDGTVLDYDPGIPPGAPTMMSAGQVVTFYTGVNQAFVVRTQDTEHPIYVAAYMTGGGPPTVGEPDAVGSQDAQGAGDPEFVNVIPAGQYESAYSFFADPTFLETSLVVIRGKATGKLEDVWLDCAGQNLTGWQPIGTRGNYEYVRVDLMRNGGPGQSFGDHVCTSGLQRMHSAGAFTATIWGWAPYASYAYPGGSALRKLVPTPLPDVH